MTEQLLGVAEVCEKLSCSRSSLTRMRNEDASFPAPITLGEKKLRWRVRDLDEWIQITHHQQQKESLT